MYISLSSITIAARSDATALSIAPWPASPRHAWQRPSAKSWC